MQSEQEAEKFFTGITPVSVAADSHAGLVRLLNEDSFGYHVEPGAHAVLSVIADGIGGHESGNIASNLCVRLLLNSWRNLDFNQPKTVEEWGDFMLSEIEKANVTIYNINEIYQIQHPMGTTIVSAVFLKDLVLIAHAGDSRCYRLRDENLQQLTDDHSFVAELVRKNILTQEEAHTHPFAHIISKSVGPIQDMKPDLNKFMREPGDRFLFCTDGLTNHVSDEEIKNVLLKASKPEEAVRILLNAAIHGGGEDNITLICVFG